MSAAGGPARLMVTGATGFVGSLVRRRLEASASGWAPRFISRKASPGLDGLDLRDAEAVDNWIGQHRPTHVLHLAGQASPVLAERSRAECWDANVTATCNLANSLAKHSPGCVFVFASTVHVYGRAFSAGQPIAESAPLAPDSVYGRTKLAAEFALQSLLAPNAQVVCLRLVNHIGAGQSREFAFPSFAAQIAEAEARRSPGTIEVGNLAVARDFLAAHDAVSAYLAVLGSAGQAQGFEAFNVASGRCTAVGQLLEHLVAHARVPMTVVVSAARQRQGELPTMPVDATRFRERFGWEPRKALEPVLLELLEWSRTISS